MARTDQTARILFPNAELMACPGPVSYTHLDVYKRQVQVGKAAPGEHVHPALHGRCARERERQDLSLIHI